MKKILPAVLSCTMLCLGADTASNWQKVLADRIPAYGHRNWIVIADSAYPAQSRDGIETIVAEDGQVAVLKRVLAALDASKHVRPIVYTDSELKFLTEDDVPGISPYRETLVDLSHNREAHALPHEEIIHSL